MGIKGSLFRRIWPVGVALLLLLNAAMACAQVAPDKPSPLPAGTVVPTSTVPRTSPSKVSSPGPVFTPTTPPTPRPTWDRTALYGAPGAFNDVIFSGERERRFRVHIPPGYNPAVPMALLLNFHGGGGNARDHEEVSGMSALADTAGFIVVYPQAWTHGSSQPRWYTAFAAENWDVQFVRDLLDHLEGRLNIDPRRIYATGFSNGATFTDRLSCELSERLAAVASCSGGYADPEAACQPVRAVPGIILQGTRDHAVYEGPNWVPPWVSRNGCAATPAVVEQEDVTCRTWTDCPAGAMVTLCAVAGAGHEWFKEPLDANEVMWEFFVAHPLLAEEGPSD